MRFHLIFFNYAFNVLVDRRFAAQLLYQRRNLLPLD